MVLLQKAVSCRLSVKSKGVIDNQQLFATASRLVWFAWCHAKIYTACQDCQMQRREQF